MLQYYVMVEYTHSEERTLRDDMEMSGMAHVDPNAVTSLTDIGSLMDDTLQVSGAALGCSDFIQHTMQQQLDQPVGKGTLSSGKGKAGCKAKGGKGKKGQAKEEPTYVRDARAVLTNVRKVASQAHSVCMEAAIIPEAHGLIEDVRGCCQRLTMVFAGTERGIADGARMAFFVACTLL